MIQRFLRSPAPTLQRRWTRLISSIPFPKRSIHSQILSHLPSSSSNRSTPHPTTIQIPTPQAIKSSSRHISTEPSGNYIPTGPPEHYYKTIDSFKSTTPDPINITSSSLTKLPTPNSTLATAAHEFDQKFKTVPFVKEELKDVFKEVPDVRYYYIGNEDIEPYPYMDKPMNEPIDLQNDLPASLKEPVRELQFSRLENGLKIISTDRGGPVCNLGLFVNAGSRHEDPSNFGVSHYIEHMAYFSTAHLSWLRTIKTLETIGANVGCNAGREHIVYHAECLRSYMPILVPLMTGNILFPRFLSWEVEKQSMEYQHEREKFAKNIDAVITEALHTTAWYNNTLGNALYAHERHVVNYTPEKLRQFMLSRFSPDNLVFVGVNVDHQELSKWLMRGFVDYNAIPPNPHAQNISPQYTGGQTRLDGVSPTLHLAVAFETPGGWNSPDLVPLTVLQTLMGGGGSFSTGGPGKGMYTRIYLQVLSSSWVESCVAFNSQYSDSGLFGLYITADASKAKGSLRLLADQFKKMGSVTEEELNRAKNALKASIWMNLENRAVVMEDIARQIMMSGRIMGGRELCDLVDKVTAADIKAIVGRLFKSPPTVVSYGNNNMLPTQQEIADVLADATK